MGASSSKTVRKLPKRTETPSWAGARTPEFPDRPLASETKNEAIEKDSANPQFLANLTRLGPVRVEHHMQKIHPVSNMNHVLRSRAQSDHDASSPYSTRDHLAASTLSTLLEERKSATSPNEIEVLAKKYNINVATLERVSRFVSSPSIGDGTTVRTVGKNGEEEVTMTAVWIDPSADGDSLSRPRIASG